MKIIGICGKKRSGKDTLARAITGYELVKNGVIDKYMIGDDGLLYVNTYRRENGAMKPDLGVFDIDRQDAEFLSYMSEVVWPIVKIYHFAEPIKCIQKFLGLSNEQIYGNEKESKTQYEWKYLKYLVPPAVRTEKRGMVTAREVAQVVGDIFRGFDDGIFYKHTLKQIINEEPALSLIADVRRVDELNAIKNMGGYTIHLKRSLNVEDTHRTEVEFDNMTDDMFDIVIDNRFMTLNDKNDIAIKLLKEKHIL